MILFLMGCQSERVEITEDTDLSQVPLDQLIEEGYIQNEFKVKETNIKPEGWEYIKISDKQFKPDLYESIAHQQFMTKEKTKIQDIAKTLENLEEEVITLIETDKNEYDLKQLPKERENDYSGFFKNILNQYKKLKHDIQPYKQPHPETNEYARKNYNSMVTFLEEIIETQIIHLEFFIKEYDNATSETYKELRAALSDLIKVMDSGTKYSAEIDIRIKAIEDIYLKTKELKTETDQKRSELSESNKTGNN